MIDRQFPCAVCLFGTLACYGLTSGDGRAGDFGTNEMAAMLPAPTLELDEPATASDWEGHFRLELLKNQNVIFDRLGPPSGYTWMRESQALKYSVHEELGNQARDAFERVFEDSAKETALAIFPVAEWMEMLPLEKWQSFGERLLQGSFGNSAEQEIDDLPATYTASESWWRNADRNGTFRYGIRPRTSPYLYVSSFLGHFDDRPLLSLEGRVRYLPFNRFQTSMSATAPLPYACELSLSALCEPLQASHTTACALRLQRVVGAGVSACALFLGVSRSVYETGVFFGFSRPW